MKAKLEDDCNYIEPTDVEDFCFGMNIHALCNEEFVGVISLNSTTVSDFHFGIVAGFNSIINLDKSSIINTRGVAIRSLQPRILKITSSVIQQCEEDGI